MKIRYDRLFPMLLALSALGAANAAHAVSCMVVGDKTALVETGEGQKSPAFMSKTCESLKLVSGKAMVSWIARDGKPNFSPVTASGVKELPAVGAEERSAMVVWSEITSKRELSRPAFMRALDEERPARIYIPKDGVIFPAATGDVLSVKVLNGQTEKVVFKKEQVEGKPLYLTPENLPKEGAFIVELSGSDKTERWPLRLVSAADASKIEAQLASIDAVEVDAAQRTILRAMLFEQLKLRVNMELTMLAN